jgi:hypothetical protein
MSRVSQLKEKHNNESQRTAEAAADFDRSLKKMHRRLAETIQKFEQGIKGSNRPEDRKTASDYLASLAPLLARAVLGEDILKDLGSIERLFGHTWIIDQKPFEDAFSSWASFKREYEQWALSGMTVNERLTSLGLMKEFEDACNSNDKERAKTILQRIDMDQESITAIISKHMKNG